MVDTLARHRAAIALASVCLFAIIGVALYYVLGIAPQMPHCCPICPDRTWPCDKWGHGLSGVFPFTLWASYLGLAISITSLVWRVPEGSVDEKLSQWRLWGRTILVNIALCYMFLPLTFGWHEWKYSAELLTIVGGAIVTLPLSALLIVLLVAWSPGVGVDWQNGILVGWGTLFVTFIHAAIVYLAYLQWYVLPKRIRLRRRKSGDASTLAD